MRIDYIRLLAEERGRSTQELSTASPLAPLVPPCQFQQSAKSKVMRRLSPFIYPFVARSCRRKFGHLYVPEVKSATVGYRFKHHWFQQIKDSYVPRSGARVLIPGSQFNCQEYREWLAAKPGFVQLLDIVDWSEAFERAKPQLKEWYDIPTGFAHGTLDNLPFNNASFDVVESRAVLEHVGNLNLASSEMARVLKPGGIAAHSIGPLYYGYGGDHCIASLGPDHGYDHLLLDDNDYRSVIRDGAHFDRLGKASSDARFWAIQGIFSFARPQDYITVFARDFEIIECAAVISPEGLAYRDRFPDRWQAFKDTGVDEPSLLFCALSVILRKH